MTTATEDGRLMETQDKDVVLENPNTISVYNQWTAPFTLGQPPKARYEVLFYLKHLVEHQRRGSLFVYLLSFLTLVY